MATYTHFEVASPSTAWVNLGRSSVAIVSSTEATITLSDGTRTKVTGTDFSQTASNTFTGNVTFAQHTSADGTIVYENVTGFSVPAQSVLGSNQMSGALSSILSGADTMNGWSGDDVLIGFAGADTINGGRGNNYIEGREGDDFLTATSVLLSTSTDYTTAAYVNATAGVTATLRGAVDSTTSSVIGNSSVGTDTLKNIFAIRGSNFADQYVVDGTFNGPSGAFNNFEGLGGNDTITGNGSTRIEYSRAAAGVNVVFNGVYSGYSTSVSGNDAAGVGNDSFTGVNSVRGSNFNDVISAAASGGGGYTFEGRGGDDTIIGQTRGINNFDFNLARYDFATGSIVVSLGATSTVTGDSSVGTDTLTNVEAYRGTAFADTFMASANFTGPYGRYNSFEGLGGDDTITGNGSTRADYQRALSGVVVDLRAGTAQSIQANDAAGIGTDTLSGVNNVRGSAFDDVILGSDAAAPERLAGNAGNDIIDGRGGLQNSADYANSPGGVTVDLSAVVAANGVFSGSAIDGFGTIDTLINIQSARGSELNDFIRGSSADNVISGQAGDDRIIGGAGNDYLRGDDGKTGEPDPAGGAFGVSTPFDTGNDSVFGGAGNDTLSGGSGADYLHGGRGYDTAYFGFSKDAATITTSGHVTTVTSGLDTATLKEVEHLIFTDGAIDLSGTYSALRTDLDGNATSDMVLQNGGTVVAWSIANGTYQGGRNITDGASGFSIVGTGDFNDDGTSDILLQKGGTVVNWLMKNGAFLSGNNITDGAAGYEVRATGDFNGDGTTDIVLQNNGSVVLWNMKNGVYQSGSLITDGAGAFKVMASGDFNGDGTSDLLLQSGGTVVEWLMKDGAYLSGSVITSGAGGFTVKGAGDFDGDGTDDVVLQNGGTVVTWMLQNGAFKMGHNVTDGAGSFEIRNVGDYNGDGVDDVALQSGGTVVDWLMKDGLFLSGNNITDGATGFIVV